MKFTDIKQKSDKELGALLMTQRKDLAKLAIDLRTKQIPNARQIGVIKKTIARILTEQNQRATKEENHG